MTAELTALETGQGETEAEQRKAQETVESYRTDLALAEKKQTVAIEQEDYDAAEQFNVSISDCQQLLQSRWRPRRRRTRARKRSGRVGG